MSVHKVEVVKLETVEPHPNADRMEIVRVWGYSCCVGKGQFKSADLAAYIEPDNLLDTTVPEFAFLASKANPAKYDGKVRIKVARLRGTVSQGVLVPARPHWKLGDDVAEELNVTHYDPPIPLSSGGETERAPEGYRPSYDVENFYRYNTIFKDGELIVVTEKLHGASGRWCWYNDRMYCGSRKEWKKKNIKNIWWRVLESNPMIEEFCKNNPDITVYGEAYGQVQDLKYGTKPGEVRIGVFDLLRGNEWINWQEARKLGKYLSWVPVIYEGPFITGTIETLADGQSLILGANHIREGIVIKPQYERTALEIGRVQLKIVSNRYLEKA